MLYLSSATEFPKKRIFTALLLGLVLGVIAALTLDQRLAQFFGRPELIEIWQAARTITNVGLSTSYFVISILLYVTCRWWLTQRTELRSWARDFFFALVGSGLFLHIVKFMVGRQRPHISPEALPNVFHPFTTNWDFQSFPSGHSQVMFTVATMLFLGFPRGKWIFYFIGAFFAFTRVITRDHFLSDVISGATIGYVGTLLSVYAVHRWLRRKELV